MAALIDYAVPSGLVSCPRGTLSSSVQTSDCRMEVRLSLCRAAHAALPDRVFDGRVMERRGSRMKEEKRRRLQGVLRVACACANACVGEGEWCVCRASERV